MGLALAAVPAVNWLVNRRMLAVSGRFTALVDRVRAGGEEPELTPDELLAAVRAATATEFGEGAAPDAAAAPDQPAPLLPSRSPASHVVFLASLVVGGALAAGFSRGPGTTFGLAAPEFVAAFGGGRAAELAALLGGGLLVGFGTRMAGGCTSGHGLCGVSRAQPGSLAATATFFGGGIAVSFLLRGLLG